MIAAEVLLEFLGHAVMDHAVDHPGVLDGGQTLAADDGRLRGGLLGGLRGDCAANSLRAANGLCAASSQAGVTAEALITEALITEALITEASAGGLAENSAARGLLAWVGNSRLRGLALGILDAAHRRSALSQDDAWPAHRPASRAKTNARFMRPISVK